MRKGHCFFLICIRLGTCKLRRLPLALIKLWDMREKCNVSVVSEINYINYANFARNRSVYLLLVYRGLVTAPAYEIIFVTAYGMLS